MNIEKLYKLLDRLLCKYYSHKWKTYAIANIDWGCEKETRELKVCTRCGCFK